MDGAIAVREAGIIILVGIGATIVHHKLHHRADYQITTRTSCLVRISRSGVQPHAVVV